MWPKANFDQISKFHFLKFDKQIASCVSTGRELSFEWSHRRISSINSKVRVTSQNSMAVKGLSNLRHPTHIVFTKWTIQILTSRPYEV